MNLFFVLVVTVLVSVAAHPYGTTSQLRQQREKRQVHIGPVDKDPNDPEYKKLAYESYMKYIKYNPSDDAGWPIFITVTKATYAVVSGSLKTIDFMVSNRYSPYLQCHSKVWEQPWLKKKDIDVDCIILDQ